VSADDEHSVRTRTATVSAAMNITMMNGTFQASSLVKVWRQ